MAFGKRGSRISKFFSKVVPKRFKRKRQIEVSAKKSASSREQLFRGPDFPGKEHVEKGLRFLKGASNESLENRKKNALDCFDNGIAELKKAVEKCKDPYDKKELESTLEYLYALKASV